MIISVLRVFALIGDSGTYGRFNGISFLQSELSADWYGLQRSGRKSYP